MQPVSLIVNGEKVDSHAVSFQKPFFDTTRFKLFVVFARAYLYLDTLGLGSMRFGLNFLGFFLLFVREFTIIHDLCNRRDSLCRDEDKV